MSPVARYDQVAGFYVAEVGDAVTDPGTAGVLRLAGDVRRRRLLDLACGQGRVARELARRGARVVGLDLSAELIAGARDAERSAPLGITYVVGDASRTDGLEAASFDGVVCNYGLSDIDDLGGALDTATTLLRPGGFLVFSILHPCFPGWGDDVSGSWPPDRGYFAEGWWRTQARSSTIRHRVGANHRTISTYLNELARRRLLVASALEPPTPPAWRSGNPAAEPVPTFLVLRCQKTEPTAP
jgi:ubiquinone/menaquinone biosynthesis C-methylase UbiE